MVTRINLLPPEIKQKDKADRIIVYMFLGLIVLAIGMLGVKMMKDIQIGEATAGLDLARTESASVNRSIGQFQAYQDRESELKRLEGVLASAIKADFAWSKVLNDVSMTTPDDVTLITMTGDESGLKLSAEVEFAGVRAGSKVIGQKPAAKWLTTLSACRTFKYVWLGSSSKQSTADQSKLVLDVTVKFSPPETAKQAPSLPPAKTTPPAGGK